MDPVVSGDVIQEWMANFSHCKKEWNGNASNKP